MNNSLACSSVDGCVYSAVYSFASSCGRCGREELNVVCCKQKPQPSWQLRMSEVWKVWTRGTNVSKTEAMVAPTYVCFYQTASDAFIRSAVYRCRWSHIVYGGGRQWQCPTHSRSLIFGMVNTLHRRMHVEIPQSTLCFEECM